MQRKGENLLTYYKVTLPTMAKKNLPLGPKEGPMLIFGGIYSNLQALNALRELAEEQGIVPENIINTGDIVGYCAQPEESLQVVRDWGIHNILGNVEIQLRDEVEDCGCNFDDGSRCDMFSRQWFPYAQEQVSRESLAWLHTLTDHLTFSYAGRRVAVVHGSANETAEFVFESTDWAVKDANFEKTQADVIIGGHCGLPFHDARGMHLWLNPGVIGMPANDGTPRVWYVVLDDSEGDFAFSHHSFTYDAAAARALMLEKKLPATYAETLVTGVWDNCEILPDAESALQGVEIRL